jgi:hypothetical protein
MNMKGMWPCARKQNPYLKTIEGLLLTDFQKQILRDRYVALVDRTEERAARFTFFFYTSRTIVTVGSLFVPALLSIQSPNSSSGEFTHQVYWSTWALSLLVSVFNAILTLFKIEKKFLYLHTDLERLNSEGWQYAELSGRYSGFYTHSQLPTHTNQFIFFCHMIEKIRMKEVEAEYSQGSQDTSTKNQPQQKSSLGELLSPTPLDPLKSTLTLKKVIEESDEAAASPLTIEVKPVTKT